jgi:predicted dehydrogenase
MEARTRWGILATGGIADRFVTDLKLLPGAELAAVGSRRLDTAQKFADHHGFARAHGSWAELAADPEVDVVYVATPHSAHYQAARLCLEAGKAVLCEKPLTLTSRSAESLVAIARERGVFLMEAMWTKALPAIRRLQEIVAAGEIGDVTAVYADFAVPGPTDPEHRLRAPELGGGALLDLGVYPVTFAHMFLGVPDRISAMGTLTPAGVDENTALLLGFPSGGLAMLHCGLVGGGGIAATVVGTRGHVEIPHGFFNTESFTLVRGQTPEQVKVPMRGNGMGYEAEEVMACLAAGRIESDLVPHAATLEVMRIMDTALGQLRVSYPEPF